MASHSSASRPRSVDMPQPETGLAEWMSKIKAMQRQVDADDEAEQKKLEEEIAASRLARQRRSHVVGSRSPTSSLDLSQKPEYSGVLQDRRTDNLPIAEKREGALRKLMGDRGISSPTRDTTQESVSTLASSRSKPEGMSLAAFIGGRATGPRLNKHAPQQDAHDPTQFEQRMRVDAPHPIFGRGGVAMPGMAAKEKAPSLPAITSQSRDMLDKSYSAGSTHNYQSRIPTTRLHIADINNQLKATPKLGDGHGTTISNDTSRTKSPHRTAIQSKNAPNTANTEFLDTTVDNWNTTHRSPTLGSTSRAKTPELSPPSQMPRSRPVSRSYESPSTCQGLTPTPTRSATEQGFARLSSSSSKKPEPVSLATFMGGRATGPRLNKHAPQQDAHDPTQFEQRTSISTPHPVFGTGGVAMPGMTAKETSSGMFKASSQLRGVKDELQSTLEEQPLASSRTGNRVGSRERTVSTPGGVTSRKYSEGDYMRSDYIRRPVSQCSIRDAQSKVATNIMNPPSPSISNSYTSRQRGISTSPVPASLQKSSPVTIPWLARPIQPVPRQSPTGPQVSLSNNPSRAFLRPPAEKEPTPSLNRLKGRGFVQSMILTSSQLEAKANEFGATSATADKARIMRARKSSVLERWQPAVSTSASSVSPPNSPKPIPVRKSHTTDSFATPPRAVSGSPSDEAVDTNRPSKMVASPSSISAAQAPRPVSRTSKKNDTLITMPPKDTPGLGSSSTLISYIKPTKTGDDPAPPPTSVPLKARSGVNGAGQGIKTTSTSDISVPPGVLLKHPTKSRARKPTKDRDTKRVQSQSTSTLTALATQWQGAADISAPSVTARVDSRAISSVSIPQASLAINQSANVNIEQSINGVQSSANHISDRLADQSTSTKPAGGRSESAKLGNILEQRALVGSAAPTHIHPRDDKPDRSPPSPLSPGRHLRIPSTGNRLTVTAQVWSEQHTREPTISEHPLLQGSSGALAASSILTDTRRSNYSTTILPSVRGGSIPMPSPDVNFSQSSAQKQGRSPELADPVDLNVIRFKHVNEPMPEVDIHSLVTKAAADFIPDPDESTISVEVMIIAKSTTSPILNDVHVFYDTETLAITHRSKSKSSGLVSTKLWGWQGKQSQPGAIAATKLQRLAKQCRTTLETVRQYEESSDLVHVLGGQLVIRQGIRAHWTSENAAMHSVRLHNGFIFIEEHDLNVANLCSGFSFCLTILDTLYVWYGCGSREPERVAALRYAHSLAVKGSTVVELVEGETDDDEMFWMMLGNDDYAKADYWKWRRTAANFHPGAWHIDAVKGKNATQLVSSFSRENAIQDSVYLIDCIWEYFVLVGANARGKRRDIQLAMHIAQKLSSYVAKIRPFNPTIHVLILPSKFPLDLQLHFRGLDEARLNQQNIPNHMNILSVTDAMEHLRRTSWEAITLRDHTMLPLGLHPSAIPK